MLQNDYRLEMEAVGPSPEQMERLLQIIQEGKPVKKKIFRTTFAAAAISATLIMSVGAAAFLGSFDFLKTQDNFAALGMNNVYEEYAYDVGVQASTERGDLFTLDRVSMDSCFCTIFYTYRYTQPQMTQEELDHSDAMASWKAAPSFTLFREGQETSLQGYQNSVQTQQYFSDPSTVCGTWQCLLTEPFWAYCEGTELELRGEAQDQSFSVKFPVHSNPSVILNLDQTFPMQIGGKRIEVKADSLVNSPLGTVLTLRYEAVPKAALGLLNSFVLRNLDTGEFIPFARIWTRRNSGGPGEVIDTYELYCEGNQMNAIELIPITSDKSVSEKKIIPLTALPSTDSGNAAGGYAPASCTIGEGQISVEMQPVGAVSASYPALYNGVGFLDRDGNELFHHTSVQKFQNRETGNITVVTSVDPAELEAKKDQIASVWFFVRDYQLQEDKAVTFPIIGHTDAF